MASLTSELDPQPRFFSDEVSLSFHSIVVRAMEKLGYQFIGRYPFSFGSDDIHIEGPRRLVTHRREEVGWVELSEPEAIDGKWETGERGRYTHLDPLRESWDVVVFLGKSSKKEMPEIEIAFLNFGDGEFSIPKITAVEDISSIRDFIEALGFEIESIEINDALQYERFCAKQGSGIEMWVTLRCPGERA